jgi:hypothetical protein
MENLKRPLKKLASLDQRILMLVSDKGVMYHSDILNQFGATEQLKDNDTHNEIHRAIRSLVLAGKIELLHKDDIDFVFLKDRMLQ